MQPSFGHGNKHWKIIGANNGSNIDLLDGANMGVNKSTYSKYKMSVNIELNMCINLVRSP